MARAKASEQVSRLLSLLPWIAAQDGPLISDVCDQFGITPKQLQSDLNVAWVVGVPPYTPDDLIDIDFGDERVWVRFDSFFHRPMNLTHDEGVALVAAGIASRTDDEPDGPLQRGLAKLAAVLEVDVEGDLSVDLGSAPPALVDALQRAAADRSAVELVYYSYARDVQTTRVVEPDRVVSIDGEWYLSAYCRSAGAPRVFRVDRIIRADVTDERFERPPGRDQSPIGGPGDDAPRVTLELEPQARWVIDQYPVVAREELDGGRHRVVLAVSAEPWLARLLVTLGPAARVVDAPDEWADAGARAAATILERYR